MRNKFKIGDTVETPYGIGVLEWSTKCSDGIYYDISFDNGEIKKFLESEIAEL